MTRICKILILISLSLIVESVYPQSGEDSIRQNFTGSCPAELYMQLFDYYSLTDDNIAENYSDSILIYAQINGLDYYEALAYRSKGYINYKKGKSDLSVDCYQKAETIAKNVDDPNLLYQIYNDLGNIQYQNNNYDKAMSCYKLAMNYAKIIGDNDSYAISMVNMAGIYNDNEEYDKAFKMYNDALDITDDINIKIAIYSNIAYLQKNEDKIEDAQKTYATLIPMLDESTDTYIYLSVLNKMSYLSIISGNYDEAINILAKIESGCQTNSYCDIRMTMYQNYHDLYLKIGDYDNSELYIEKLNSLRDSVIAIDNTKELNELEYKNLRERTELEKKHHEEEIHFQRTINAILCGTVAIVAIFIVIITLMLVRKNRLNKILNKLNSDLKQRDSEISSNLDYAREIQLGCMSNSLTESNLQMFVLDRPKVVVGGDFYISQTKGNASYVVVGDCTGHGISGGFLSVLGIKSVYAAFEKYDTLPEMASFINNEFCEIVSSAENLKGESLCLSMVRICGNELRFLGSKQKMWIVSGDRSDCSSVNPLASKPEVREYKSANAIMGSAGGEEFREEIINVKSGDVVFLSSDGYPDQFGAEGKLKYSRFRNILLECSQMKPNDAKSFLSEKLDEWRGEYEQTDDVMVVGMYFPQTDSL